MSSGSLHLPILKSIILLSFLVHYHWSPAQSESSMDSNISGIVTDTETGDPIPGVNIILEGTAIGTVSGKNGEFKLSAAANSTLIFSSIGYATYKFNIGQQEVVNVAMSPVIRTLSEIVITGYSTNIRSKINGSVSSVESKDLMLVPSGNVEQQFQGKLPGVTVVTNGQPGTTSQVRIHGYGSRSGPLYVVDGVSTNSIEFLAPSDIAKVTVLKDASEASIYGARAAGGVIAIATRNGIKGSKKTNISYDGLLGITAPGSGPSVLNPQQQAEWTWNAIRNAAIQLGEEPQFGHPQYGSGETPILPDWLLVGPDFGVVGDIDLDEEAEKYNIDFDAGPIYQVVPANKSGTNWYDAFSRYGLLHRHAIGLSGGGDHSMYYVGLSMQIQEGNFKGQSMERYGLRSNSEFDLLPDKLRIGENLQVTYIDFQDISGAGSSDDENRVLSLSKTSPIIPVFDQFGGYASNAAPGLGIFGNPIAVIDRRKDNKDFITSIFGNAYLEFEPLPNLIVRSSFGGRYQNINGKDFSPRTYENATNFQIASFEQSSAYNVNWIFTNTISFERTFGLNQFKLLAGQEVLKTGVFRSISGRGVDPFIETADFVNLNTVEQGTVEGFHSNGIAMNSYFGHLSYDFDVRYQATLVVRRDGSSRFAERTRWGTFPAWSIGWRLSEEKFMDQVSFIDNLKIRVGFGKMGNSNSINPNNQFSFFTPNIHIASYDVAGTNSRSELGLYRSQIGDPNARWETAITHNIGLDASLFRGKLDLVVDVWREDVEDLLFPFPITVQTGFFARPPFINVGEMRNQGIDLRIGYRSDFLKFGSFEVTLNGSFLSNRITSLGPGLKDIPNFSINYRGITPILNLLGRPVSNFFGFNVQGLFASQSEVDAHALQSGAAPGRFRFEDINDDGILDQDDRTSLGSPIPDFTGGIGITVSYKNFDLNMNGYASIGNEIYNISRLYTDFYPLFPGGAISSRVLNSWRFDNPGADAEVPIFENIANFSTITQSNSYYVEDGSYFRLQNITLGYNFPSHQAQRWGFSNLRVFVSGLNLLTITDYTGLDPSVGGNLDFNFGVDLGNFPITKGWNLGLNVSF